MPVQFVGVHAGRVLLAQVSLCVPYNDSNNCILLVGQE